MFGIIHFPPFPYPRLEPFAHQTGNHSILHPAAQKFQHLPMNDSVEELAQIHLKIPLHLLLEALHTQIIQRLMR